ncbi:MAG: feruloyl-CoA synthase [Burkholderiales bacterium]|nr:feruloyl-CoA synthase [Burkholderiales bacterium]MDE2159664.1 feruloyl-CoA synthase [Burkholderiales bacterium]MDE2503533.1 feruloyl-CoA synthase [Burkholderiales bacterium]
MAPPDPACRADPPAFLDDPRLIAPRAAVRVDLGEGGFVLRSPAALAPYARCVGEWLEHWAAATPEAPAFAEPAAGGGWRCLGWGELRRQVGAVAQGLLDLDLAPGKPLAVLSDNGLDHLVLLLAGMHIGRAVCTVSSAYCRLAQNDYGRITAILAALDPALVYASTAAVYGPALAASGVPAVAVFSQGAGDHPGALPLARLLAARETPAVMRAYAAITPDTHAKYLLTSGSTGTPKIVINTQRMLCANQQMLAQTLRFLDVERPVLLDWLPWSHTFGGNHNVGIVLRSGGTMYIDDGRPLPGAIERTIAHLREIQPTIYFNVPRGYEMLLPALESDAALARHFFGRLRMAFYAGAGMPLATWQRLEAAAARVRDEPLWLTTSWGSTETAPAITFANWKLDRPGVIGLPLAGTEVKFVPNAGKLEMRVRGDHVFPGYRDHEEATRAAFDDEGYYRIGDAGHLLDADDPLSGIVFNGRVAEDFKLTSGTWVSVGTLRVRVVSALSPYAQDAVITGHDRSEIGALIFLTEAGRALPPAQIAEHVRAGLRQLASEGGGSSQTPARALLLPDTPDAAAGEITDKGYVNQRLVLARRADFVHALHAEPLDPRVIRP